ncbi:MAG: hypothetical protein J6P21_02715 [Clostridia bacterium]|nr:hypothetical protein [Clostridia bacterium]
MTLYGIASILVGTSYFFGSFCPSVEKFFKQVKDTFSSSSSDGDSKDKKKEDEGLVKKSYEIAKGTGKSVLKLLNVGKEGFITSYVMFGTSRDEKGEINLWNWFEEAKKIHKDKKSETIFDDEDENIGDSNQDKKVAENLKVVEEDKLVKAKMITKSKTETIFNNEDESGSNSNQNEKITKNAKIIEENKSGEARKVTKSKVEIINNNENSEVNFENNSTKKTN